MGFLFGGPNGNEDGDDSICFGCCYVGDCQSPLFHCILSAYLSIFIGTILTVLSFLSAWSLHSMSMYALSLMAVIDTAGSVLVVYFLQWKNWTLCGGDGDNDNNYVSYFDEKGREVTNTPIVTATAVRSRSSSGSGHGHGHGEIHTLGIEEEEKEIEEQRLTFVIGVFMTVISLLLLGHSIQSLWVGDNPSYESEEDAAWGNVISIGGTCSGLGLAFYKYYVAKAARSSIVMADAISSFCTGLASLVSLVVSLMNNLVWWFDGTAGLLIAVYTLYSGILTMFNARFEIRQIQQQSTLRASATKSYDHFLETSREGKVGPNGKIVRGVGISRSHSSDDGTNTSKLADGVVLEIHRGRQRHDSFDSMRVSQTQKKQQQARTNGSSYMSEQEGVGGWIVSSLGYVISLPFTFFRFNSNHRSDGEYMSIPDEDEETVKKLLTRDPDEVVTVHI